MPKIFRMAGNGVESYRNGYMKGARTLELPKMRMAARSKRRPMSGISHHFFSSRRKRKNSLAKDHMGIGGKCPVLHRGWQLGNASGGVPIVGIRLISSVYTFVTPFVLASTYQT